MNDPACVRIALLALIREFRASPCRRALSQGACPDPVSRMFRLIEFIEAAGRRRPDAAPPPGCEGVLAAGYAADVAIVATLADCQAGRHGRARARLAALVRPGLHSIAFAGAMETASAFKAAGVEITPFAPPGADGAQRFERRADEGAHAFSGRLNSGRNQRNV